MAIDKAKNQYEHINGRRPSTTENFEQMPLSVDAGMVGISIDPEDHVKKRVSDLNQTQEVKIEIFNSELEMNS
jgi:hypothetical protein